MLLIVGIVIGVIIGWLIPQPQWAANLITKIKNRVGGTPTT